ncbi:MAG TPA: TonB family protein [Ignavibacteria bacterium]|nr:TonB family protein [Ignavibacteria bacterium]
MSQNPTNKVTKKAPIDGIELLNMPYGAPDLKAVLQKYTLRGLITAILIFALGTGGMATYFYLDAKAKENVEDEVVAPRIIMLEDLETPPPASDDAEPPPPDLEVPQTIVALKDLEAMTPEPVKKELSEISTIKTQQKLDEITQPVSKEGDENAPKVNYTGPIGLKEKKVEEKIEKKEEKVVQKKDIYQQFEVEKAPSPVNLSSVRSSMRYPEIARSQGIEGRITVKVLVGTNGSVQRVGGISGPEVFHSEVRDKVENLQFTPALQNGQPVKCWVSVPFSFTLSKGFKKKDEEKSEDE